MPLKIKLSVGNEIRRFTLPDDCSYDVLRTTLCSLFGNTLPSEFVITYKDEEGDLVSITSDIEFHAAKILAADPLLRLSINVAEKPKEVVNPAIDIDSIMQQVRSHPNLKSFFIGSETSSPNSSNVEDNLRDFLQKFLSVPLIQQLIPFAQRAQQAAQQAAQQMKPYAQVAQEAGQQAAQQLIPLAQAAQKVAQEAHQQFLPIAQQAGQQLLPLAQAAQQAAQQAQEQLLPFAQQAAQQAVNQVQKVVQQATAKASSTTTPVATSESNCSPVDVSKQYRECWQEQLSILQDMGFQDTEHNIHLLEQFEGRTDRVIEALLNGFVYDE